MGKIVWTEELWRWEEWGLNGAEKGEKEGRKKELGQWKGDSRSWMRRSSLHSVDISLHGLSKVSVLNHLDTLNLLFVHQEAPSCSDARWGGTGGRWNLLVTSMVSILPPHPACPSWPTPPTETIHPALQWERPEIGRFRTAPNNEPLWMAWMWCHCSTRGH